MKNNLIIILFTALCLSCNTSQKEKTEKLDVEEESVQTDSKDRNDDFPEDIAKVFKAHGGIKTFDGKNTLIFEMEKPEGNEKHITDLKSRKSRIEAKNYTLGFDGQEAWLEQDSTYFKRDPRFYHNLMFYFYAMPFVLGDDGITYEKTESINVENQIYPGYKISYEANVGDSPKDNYFLYYDPQTFHMKYLGYTVTYFSKENSDKISLIEYNDWQRVDELLLPKKLIWRDFENKEIGKIKKEMSFVNVSVTEKVMSPSTYKKTSIERSGTL